VAAEFSPGTSTARPRWRRLTHPKRPLAIFVLSALLVSAAVATATVLISGNIARSSAVAEAERVAVRLADLLVTPLLHDALAGDAASWAELDRDLGHRMSDGSIVSVVVWTADGQVLWSTIDELEGQQFPVSEDLERALAGETVAALDEDPEALYDFASGPVLEVYVPIDIDGTPYVVETYLPADTIDEQASLLRGEIVPLAVGALVVLQLVQLPIAASMSRRARQHEAERLSLMARALTASDRERRAIAGDVHDGPVQDLAGVSYALAALRPSIAEDRRPVVDRLTTTVQHAVASLRRLMVDIYPPDLSGTSLGPALDDLGVRLREAGTEVSVTADQLPGLHPEYAAVLYRTAKEAMANVSRHAGAQHVWVDVSCVKHGDDDAVLLTVADDGVGYEALPVDVDGSSDGHLGLRLVRERIEDLDGEVRIESRADGGTVLTAVVPLRAE
jgi:two-component system, NarL family, sensor kinase